jgi:hypothetical protein
MGPVHGTVLAARHERVDAVLLVVVRRELRRRGLGGLDRLLREGVVK